MIAQIQKRHQPAAVFWLLIFDTYLVLFASSDANRSRQPLKKSSPTLFIVIIQRVFWTLSSLGSAEPFHRRWNQLSVCLCCPWELNWCKRRRGRERHTHSASIPYVCVRILCCLKHICTVSRCTYTHRRPHFVSFCASRSFPPTLCRLHLLFFFFHFSLSPPPLCSYLSFFVLCFCISFILLAL